MSPAAANRDRFIDVIRIIGILVVVLGHWVATTVIDEGGWLVGQNALEIIPESHIATWMLQVMPLLFFAGGFANARSLALHDHHSLAFTRTRFERLLTPTVVFLSVWMVVGLVAELLPLAENNEIAGVADIAALPMWFLGVYVIVVTLAPWLHRLHRRFGWRVPIVFVVGAILVDVVVYPLGIEAAGVVNFAFVWLLPHQLGFFHADGRLDGVSGRRGLGVAAVGLGGLVLVTTVFDYPVSMIAVPGADRWNTYPPSVALVATTLWLIGLALVFRGPLRRWGERRVSVVRMLGSVPLTLYLWHVAALAIAAAILRPLGFPTPDTGSVDWWLLRVPWVLAIVPIMVIFAVVFRRFEVHPRPASDRHTITVMRKVAVGLGVVTLAYGLFGFGVTGFDHIATLVGGEVLDLTMNPLQNALHVAMGLCLIAAGLTARWTAVSIWATVVAFLAAGAFGWDDGIARLAMNPAGARFHVVLAVVGVLLAGVASVLDRSRRMSPGR